MQRALRWAWGRVEMTRVSVAFVAALLIAGSADAATIVMTATEQLNVSGSVSTVTATLTIDPGGETVQFLGNYGVTVLWNPFVVRVVGSNGTTTFGKSSQGPILPGLSSPTTLPCVSSGENKGKACTLISQVAQVGAPFFIPGGSVTIGTLLLEVLPPPGGPDPIGTLLGLSILTYHNNGTGPAPVLDPSFTQAVVIPEPATAALLSLGLAERRRC
jgi:hypothetical protein